MPKQLYGPDSMPMIVAAWPRRTGLAKALLQVTLDEGLCGEDYDDQIKGALAAGLIAGLAYDPEDVLQGAFAFKYRHGDEEAEPNWAYDPERDDFALWIDRHIHDVRPPRTLRDPP